MSIKDELKRKVSIIKLGKQVQELSEEEKRKLKNLLHDIENCIDIYSLIVKITEGKTIESQKKDILEQLKKMEEAGYAIDLEKHITKVYIKGESIKKTDERNDANKEKIINIIRKEKLEKLKAQIPIGIETKKKMSAIKSRIGENKSSNINNKKCEGSQIAKLIYGNSWYIALDSEGNIIETKINRNLDRGRLEQKTYEKTLKEFRYNILY